MAPDTASYVSTRNVPLEQLTPYPGNAKRGDVEAIRASLRRNGQYRALVVRRLDDDSLIVLAGNHTLQALAAEDVPKARCEIIRCDDATARRINLADNRTAELGGYDDDALLELLAGLDGDLDGTGWTDTDLAALLEPATPPAAASDLDDVPQLPANPITKPGDLWLLGPHRVLCGDCRDTGDLERLLDGRRVNVAFTSPPYASQRAYDESSGFQPIPPDAYVDWFDDVQAGVREVLAKDGSWFVNIKEHAQDGQRHLYVKDLTLAHVRRWGWRFVDELCWVDSKNGVPGGWPNRFKDAWEPVFHYSRQSRIKFRPLANGTASDAVFDYSPDTATSGTGSGLLGEKATGQRAGTARPSNVLQIAASSQQGHSAAFPVALPAWFIRAYSDPGDLVLDPFLGSGSTLMAAHSEDRHGYGLEISPAYVDVICRRWQDHTGEKPIHAGTGQPRDFTVPANA